MKGIIKRLWNDENGMTTMEIIIGSTLLGGAALLVGYGMTAGFRGKTGDFVGDLEDIQAMDDEIKDGSGYGYAASSSVTGATGMLTDVDGN